MRLSRRRESNPQQVNAFPSRSHRYYWRWFDAPTSAVGQPILQQDAPRCPKCGEENVGLHRPIERIGYEWFCNTCSHSWRQL